MKYVFEPHKTATAPVDGGGLFPVRRIFCVGKNYADHVKEMGGDPKTNPPVFFTKPADAVAPGGAVIAYPQACKDFHFEGELVLALHGGGTDIQSEEAASKTIFGYAAGCDLTRRDHQAAAKKAGAPWDTAKAFDYSAPMGDIVLAAQAGDLTDVLLTTSVNGETRQKAPLSSMIWSASEIIMALSRQFELKAGDLIFTGTPEGVGPLVAGDKVKVEIGSLPPLQFSISAR